MRVWHARDPEDHQEVLEWIGVETDRPMITQVSRFDPWKDQRGVIAASDSSSKRFGTSNWPW
jgi:hypothetical protein